MPSWIRPYVVGTCGPPSSTRSTEKSPWKPFVGPPARSVADTSHGVASTVVVTDCPTPARPAPLAPEASPHQLRDAFSMLVPRFESETPFVLVWIEFPRMTAVSVLPACDSRKKPSKLPWI